MKTLKLIALGIVLMCAGTANAQVSVNVNIGSPPMWGPAGYTDVQYYYLPDVQAYYDIRSSMFIYQNSGVWVHRTYLPTRYRNYDLYGGYKVVMTDYHGKRPYTHFREYRTKYARGYRGHEQHNIGMRPEKGNSYGRPSNARNHGSMKNGSSNVKNPGNDNSHGDGKKDNHGHDNGKGKKK
jgi:hypothetical protein